MRTLENGEILLETEQDFAGLTLNQKGSKIFSLDTELDFTGNECKAIAKKSKSGNYFLNIHDAKKNGNLAKISIGMLLNCPFLPENREILLHQDGITQLTKDLIACCDKSNPGKEAWFGLIKGKKIKVIGNLTAPDRVFGDTQETPQQFNNFDYIQ
jgi:hypothetical protein